MLTHTPQTHLFNKILEKAMKFIVFHSLLFDTQK